MPKMQIPRSITRSLAWFKRSTRRPAALLVVLLVLVTAAIWAVTLWEIRLGRSRAIESETIKNTSLARAQEERVLRSLQVLDQALLVLRQDFLHKGEKSDLVERVQTMQLDRESVGVVSIIDARGNVTSTTATGMVINFADREYFKYHANVVQDTLLVGKPILGKLTGKWLVSLTRRINQPDGSFGGVVFMAVAPTYLMAPYSPEAMGLSSTMALIGLDGIARVRNNMGRTSYGDDVRTSQLFQELPRAPQGQYIGAGATDGQLRMVSYRTVGGYPLVLVVGSLVSDVLDTRKESEAIYLGLALLSTGLVIALGAIVSGAWSRIEGALTQARISERKFRSIIDASPVPMAMNDDAFRVTYVNPAFTHIFGYTRADIPSLEDWWPKAYPDAQYRQQVKDQWADELGRSAMTSTPFNPLEVEVHCKNGAVKHVMVGASELSESMQGEYLVVLYDITHQKTVQASLNSLVMEKNALLKEVHHRVKNNLQVITSLLRLESSRAEHASVQAVLGDMRWRIRSMALLHESLYRSGNFASVRLDSYLKQLSTEVFRAGLDRNARISLVLELDPVTVSMTQATPLGLIVNELISNVLEHGFAEGGIGQLKIELRPADAQGHAMLRVSDNGRGLPSDFERRKSESLGMQMVSDLVMQVGGTLTVGPPPQAIFSIVFVPEGDAAA